ncbi:hypothetical protein [Teredinibacter haidensis]|uniref:hypothetical protein n=1 Tax=Teredinibacter haidensis TaxID=2731755 RepID=UPI000948A5D9|nr:hypothetical protein [Teredinibacter haidensis]
MYIKFVIILGAIVLLACTSFAALNLESSDTWISIWVPFVIAGTGLCLFGAIAHLLGHKK